MSTTYEQFSAAGEQNRRLLRQEGLILDVTESVCELLEQEGLSQTDLARRLNCGKSHVSQLLNGRRNLTLKTLADIAGALGVKPSFTFSRAGYKKAERADVVRLKEWTRRANWADSWPRASSHSASAKDCKPIRVSA